MQTQITHTFNEIPVKVFWSMQRGGTVTIGYCAGDSVYKCARVKVKDLRKIDDYNLNTGEQ